ncbi:hypothetical protein ACQNKF_004684, partial [Escherichia coli]
LLCGAILFCAVEARARPAQHHQHALSKHRHQVSGEIDASFMERRYYLKGKPASAELFEQSKVMIFTQLQTKKGRERPCVYMTLTKTLTKFNQHPQH